uniref:Uncharacterized protein n=1 Tax=Arundo donax TaxID=35708 RepID=A0A0A9GZ35_ARUDO
MDSSFRFQSFLQLMQSERDNFQEPFDQLHMRCLQLFQDFVITR